MRVASHALRAFSRCCSASLCSMFTKLDDELELCGTGVTVCDELFPAELVVAIAEHGRKLELLPLLLAGVSSVLKLEVSCIGGDGVTGALVSFCVLLSLELFSH